MYYINDIEALFKISPTTKSLVPDSFSAEFYQNFGEKIKSMLLMLFHKMARKTIFKLFVGIQYCPDNPKQRKTKGKKRKLLTNLYD